MRIKARIRDVKSAARGEVGQLDVSTGRVEYAQPSRRGRNAQEIGWVAGPQTRGQKIARALWG
jgi:hypothetical protein